MGLADNIRRFFSSSKNTQAVQIQPTDEYEKSSLADRIIGLVDSIKRINSLDRSIWNLSNISSRELKRRSVAELQSLNSSLENRLAELNNQIQQGASRRDALEASKWTGQKPANMSSLDFH